MYTIAVEKLHPDAIFSPLGVEIRPPLTAQAAEGVCEALTYQPPEEETKVQRIADKAHVTRNDIKGTALFVAIPVELHRRTRTDNNTSIERYLGAQISLVMDPTVRYDYEVVTSQSED